MKVNSLHSVSPSEANEYLTKARGDEVIAAFDLACDRLLLEGDNCEPDSTEVHHALFLLRRAVGKSAPSYDQLRLSLRRLQAA
jgi:hypothetical protein